MEKIGFESPKTSWLTRLVGVPFLLLALAVGYWVWVMETSLLAKGGYVLGFILCAYWLYSPKSPRHIIARQILSLIILWGVWFLFIFFWIAVELNPKILFINEEIIFEEPSVPTAMRVTFSFWSLIFGFGVFFASRRIYRSLETNLQLSSLFSRYVSPDVITQMLKSQDDFFQTKKMELSVLFVDLRGFTATSANLSAEQVKDLINIFMGIMIPVAHSWRGTVDKTVGDEIMVLFGAPIPYPDHADQAVKTALAFFRAYIDVAEKWKKRGLPILEMGIGINSGEMVVGNIGCAERVDYTVLGHHVNLGARLCGKAAGSQILISEFTRTRLSEELQLRVPSENYLEFDAKGIQGKVKAYTVNTTQV